jgi:hypothetical protein
VQFGKGIRIYVCVFTYVLINIVVPNTTYVIEYVTYIYPRIACLMNDERQLHVVLLQNGLCVFPPSKMRVLAYRVITTHYYYSGSYCNTSL